MPLVTVTVFRYKPLARFGAFANMGRFLMRPVRAEGLLFSKLMGSGHDFGLIPDFSTYVHLGVWTDEAAAWAFQDTNSFRQLSAGAEQTGTLYLQPQRAHGLWDGQNPFGDDKKPTSGRQRTGTAARPKSENRQTYEPASGPTAPVAVLTRATIRPGALPDFWRHVPQARQRLRDHADNLLFGIGVGEVPVVQQCTISVWRDSAAVEQYAYRQSGHQEVVRLTRQRNWYSEELFARFTVLRAEGTLFAPVQCLLPTI